MSRHELCDTEGESIEEVLEVESGMGCPRRNHREILNGICWVLATSFRPPRHSPRRRKSSCLVSAGFRSGGGGAPS